MPEVNSFVDAVGLLVGLVFVVAYVWFFGVLIYFVGVSAFSAADKHPQGCAAVMFLVLCLFVVMVGL